MALRRLFTEPHRVVGAAVLGIDLRGVGQHEPRHGCLQRRDALVVPDGDDRLRGRLAVQPAVEHPRAIEGRVHLAQAGQVALEQLVGVEAEQLVAVLEVVGHVEEAAAVVALGLDEVGVLDQADERQLAVGHVGPVEVAERPVELEQQAERGEVLDRRLGEAGELREDVVRDGGDHPVVALRAGRLEAARVVAGAERAGSAVGDLEVRRDASRRAVDQHAPAVRLDPRAQRLEQRLPRAGRVAELLLARVLAAAQAQLVPDPDHGDLVGAGAELAPQHRAPDLAVGGLPHPLLDPRPGGHPLERRPVVRQPLQRRRRRRPSARATSGGERLEAQQVAGRRERPLAPVREHRHARRAPLQLQAQLVVERGDVPVGGEQVVVVALEQVAAADVDRRRHPAQPRPALVDVDLVPGRGEPVGGDQPARRPPR